MSFLTERALGDHMLARRGGISAIRQVCHPRLSPDLLRLAQFFSTTGVYVAAEFRFTGHRQAIVLAEASTVRQLSAPGVSHVSTVVISNGDISTINPLRHTVIWTSLREWGQQLATEWNQWLTSRGDNLVPTDDIDVRGLRSSRHESAVVLPELLTWTRDIEHRAWVEYVELLIIQAWTTEVKGDLLGFLSGSVRPGHRQLIVQELTIPLAQLVDDLRLDIVSRCDESLVPHILSRTLTPYLQWSACLEEQGGDSNPPSQREYLDPRRIIDLSFFQPQTASEEEGLTQEEDEEENEENNDEENDEEEEEETPEEGSYSEHSEGEQSEEEENEEQEESEWESLGEEVGRTKAQEEDLEVAARRREEIEAGKQPLDYASTADLPISNDPTKDPEPPKPEDGDLATETSSAPARRRRSRSPSPSTSAHPSVRARTNAGHRASSPVLIPSSL
ncbi:hypothetical protein CBR_g26232 [Chara braunii]|uniref:Uncharacterized protein n=1 Tax=Chara braunii TaxID=69332 RepID=A0A388L7B4_CHABU|nr:hypothetical protein CBR_g26232 [Chara braunii]|eukprot:GBG78199.1 hypothetical protein CBR_g26232 [Chara braunii]